MKKILLLLTLCMIALSYANAQTETEPNNVWNQSNLTTLGATGTGTTAVGGDEDWWRVAIPGDGKLTVNWTSTSSTYIYCQVYDTLGTIILANNYTNTTSVHNIDGLAKGTYYIRFFSYSSAEAVNYNFTPTFTPASVANNTEPDSTIALAKILPLNGSVTGHVGYFFNNHRDSIDIYKVTVVQDGALSYTLKSENGQYIYAQLFDGDGSSYFVGNYTNSIETLTKDGLAPGVYYIKIFCYSANDFAPYTLSNTFVAPPSANDPVANETAATASTLPLNGSVTGHTGYHYNGARDDIDWWKVTVVADGRIDFTITSDNGQNVYAQLYDGDGATYFIGSYTTSTASYSKDGLAPGVYYIKVFTYYNSEFASYSLSNTFTQPAQSNDVGSNDVFTNALPFAVNSSLTGHIGYRYNGNVDTNDWYKIVLTADGRIDYSITSQNGQNVYAQLYDGDGATYFIGSYTTSTANYSKDGLSAGTYYLNIFTYYSSEFAPYTLSNTITIVPSPNDVEPNGTRATASVLAVNSTIQGHTGYHYNGNRDDNDYYALTLPVDGRLTFGVSDLNGQNVYVQLFDNDGTTYLAGSYTTTSSSYTVNNLAAGTYYLRIATYYTSEFSPYTLTNSLDPMNFTAETAGDNSIAAKGTTLPANTATGGHINYYYNLGYDNPDWWKVGYDGVGGTMALQINLEQDHFDTDYPYVNYALYLDTLLAPVSSGQLHSATNTINLTGLSTGIYYLQIASGYNTFGAYQLTAGYTEKCANVVSITSSTQLAGCNGNIVYGITGGLAPYTVQLYKNGVASGAAQTTNATISFSNLGVGTYYLRSYSFGGSGSCNNVSGNTVFAIPATPTISSGGGATTFCQGGSVTLTSSAAASYLWSNGATTQSITVSASGTFTVTAYNAAGCASLVSASTTVTVNPLPTTPTISAGGATTFCAGGSVTLTSSTATSYLWSNGATTQSITVNAGGSYSVVVKNANGCSSATSASTTVTVNPLPATPIVQASGATTFCAGGSVTLTSSAATSYLWSNGATTQAITVSTTGTFTVIVKNVNGCSSAASAATAVTVNPLPTVTLAAFTSVCNTDAAFTLTGGSPAGGTYSGTGVSGGQFNPAAAGVGTFTITYSYTNANSCTNTATQPITVTNCGGCTPTVTAGGPVSFCQGGSVTLTSSAASSYAWSNGATTQSITVNTSGSYSVTTTSATGCVATSSATVVTVNPLQATPTVTAGGPVSFCAGGSVTLTSSAATSYLWSNGATTQSITVNASGNYSVTATNAGGCSATSAATTVTVNPLPATPTVAAGSATTFCAGGSVTLTSSAATSYLWSNGATTQSITVNASGSYSVVIKNANGCSATSAVTTVTVNPLPTVGLTAFAAVCSTDAAFTLTGGSPAGGTYSGTGVSAGQFNPATAGAGTFTITYSYTNANGCTATAQQSITVNICTAPCSATAIAAGPTTFCQGGSVLLTASAGASYLWSNGATTQSITVTTNGSYSVAVTNANNCTATSNTIAVTVNPLPSVTLAAFAAVCNTNAAFSLTGGSPAGGTYSGTGVTGGQFSPASAGIGTFVIAYSYTNANGCTASATGSITVNNCNTCTATITADKTTTFCQGGSLVLTASAGASYLWSNGATTQSITVTSSGNYTVTVTSAGGCVATSAALAVTVNPLPDVPVITASGPTTFCQGGSVTLTSSAASSYLWSNGATTQSITVTTSGNFTVTVKNASGCARTSAATAVVVNNCGGTYCNANGNSKNKGFILNVYFRNIFNTTGWSNGGYGNYLNLSASVNKGSAYIIAITPGFNSLFSINGMYTKVWIDWNQDGDFDDAGETVFAPAGQSFFLRLGVVYIPLIARSGSTRMRVAMRSDASPSSCGSFNYGEVEDYTINVGGSTGSRNIEPTAEEAITLSESFNLYPNPVSEELVIQRSGNDNARVVATSTAMQIIDMNGRVMIKAMLNKSTEVIDVRRLPAGMYIVQLKTNTGISTKKIIVSH